METTLEREFEEFKAIHKYSVLKAKLIKYYDDLQNANVICFNSEDRADEFILNLILKNNGYELFNEKYELAWKEIAPYLD